MGVGIDMVDVAEVTSALERHGRHYLDRVYAPAEQAETASMSPRRMREYLAGRFAAKEAVLKALRPPAGAGLGRFAAGVACGDGRHEARRPARTDEASGGIDMFEAIERVFLEVTRYGILAVEALGVLIILSAAMRALLSLLRDRRASLHILTEGITTALSFLLASEVLKTITAPDWRDIGMTCAILMMRAGMTLLIHWESKHED